MQNKSRTITVLVVAGTRPEVIKLAPVISASSAADGIRTVVCLTGQHRELADEVAAFFGLDVNYRLELMMRDQNLNSLTSLVLPALLPILQHERPDMVIVQGDTLTCFAASLAAFFEKIPVCHVEAGLRTHNLEAPFPEEALRQMVTRITSLHCAATSANRSNLLAEGVSDSSIILTGNTVIDALYRARELLQGPHGTQFLQLSPDVLSRIEASSRLILITGHRREHFGSKLENICQALSTCALKYPDAFFIYPVHPNPNVFEPVRRILAGLENVMLLPPLNYPDFIYLMSLSYLIITDSGGIQEEAPALGKPVVVTRDETERQEALATGQVVLAGTSKARIVQALDGLLSSTERYSRMTQGGSPYGDGKAANRIVSSVIAFIELRRRESAIL